jgi:hypothetical protein
MIRSTWPVTGFLFLTLSSGCGGSDEDTGSNVMGTGGFVGAGTGGSSSDMTGGAPGGGGVPAPATGGSTAATGGTPSTGGAVGAGGAPIGAGGALATGGEPNATGGAPAAGGVPNTPIDFDATPADFECLRDWTKVRNFRITNKLGMLDEALAVANQPGSGDYPVGTIIQLVTIEAMVKRAAGWSPETNDWEFFFLNVSQGGTQIVTRGKTDVVNQFGGNCFDCHSAAERQYDLVCETGHGCAALPVPTSVLVATQDSDPRCN